MPVNVEIVSALWLPNVFMYNLKDIKIMEVLSAMRGLWITRCTTFPTGRLSYYQIINANDQNLSWHL